MRIRGIYGYKKIKINIKENICTPRHFDLSVFVSVSKEIDFVRFSSVYVGRSQSI